MVVRLKKLSRSGCRRLIALALSLSLNWSLLGCANQSRQVRLVDLPDIPRGSEVRKLSGPISEVAPPAIFLYLAKLVPNQRPQVAIASPRPDQTIEDTRVEVKLDLKNFSIYKDEDLELGPHIQLILDNQPARSIYSLEEAITFEDLAPGSHTLRAIAVQPWGESFKDETAYAQTRFHVFAPTEENTPDPDLPLLTFIEPQGSFSAEPLLLDFYLTNAPLHFLAQENKEDELSDWKIRATVNGKSFVFDRWQPIYLKGFEPGRSWIQLTLIDEKGQPIQNAFNSTVRLIDYDPDQQNSLAKLVRGELPLEQAGKTVVPNYQPPVEVPAEEVSPVEDITPDEPEIVEADQSEFDKIEAEKLETEALDAEAERARLEREKTEEIEELEELEVEELKTEEPEAEKLENESSKIKPESELELTAPEVLDAQTEAKPIEVTGIDSATDLNHTEIEETSADDSVAKETEAAPAKKSLFGRFFNKKQPSVQQSPQVTEPLDEPSSTVLNPAFPEPLRPDPDLLEPLPSELDAPVDKVLTDPDDTSVLSPSEEAQPKETRIESTDIEPDSGKATQAPEIPTDLSSPAEIEDVELEENNL